MNNSRYFVAIPGLAVSTLFVIHSLVSLGSLALATKSEHPIPPPLPEIEPPAPAIEEPASEVHDYDEDIQSTDESEVVSEEEEAAPPAIITEMLPNEDYSDYYKRIRDMYESTANEKTHEDLSRMTRARRLLKIYEKEYKKTRRSSAAALPDPEDETGTLVHFLESQAG